MLNSNLKFHASGSYGVLNNVLLCDGIRLPPLEKDGTLGGMVPGVQFYTWGVHLYHPTRICNYPYGLLQGTRGTIVPIHLKVNCDNPYGLLNNCEYSRIRTEYYSKQKRNKSVRPPICLYIDLQWYIIKLLHLLIYFKDYEASSF